MKGPQPSKIRDEAKICAGNMGYRWVENTEPDLPFDAFMFRPGVIVAVKLKKIRYTIDNDVIIESKYPDDVEMLRSLPLPPCVIRELWVRTQNERAWRRFYILPNTTAEIEFNSAEGYRNTHFDEKKMRNAPFRRVISWEDLKKGTEKYP
jgi:hypothetical protein